jgi:hypothetical protein
MAQPSFANQEFGEQLLLLRSMTERTGILHEAQLLQLKMYPIAMITNSKSAEIKVDIEGKVIDFFLKLDKKKNAELEIQCERVSEAVKWLLGPDWLVRVRVRDKVIFRGPRTVGKANV